jgi:mannosylglycerate hydrolase
MVTLHLVSHTHWDREWYLTFQQFRLELVHLLDGLLEILQTDPEFRSFMLDGQTIPLQDYLQIRPERLELLKRLIRGGRLLVGPWYVLPDEFLVSAEAIVRNLLEGQRTARALGAEMNVGYLPDTFGHVGQMPQILLGFGIPTACVQRGLAEEPCELWWESAGGARVLMAYLRDGYGNGASLDLEDSERFAAQLEALKDSLQPHSAASHLLVMLGTDHMEPSSATSQAVASFRSRPSGIALVHSSLPEYLRAVQEELTQRGFSIPIVSGELRESKRHPVLRGVLSARIWIKQRNEACQSLLERWAEPWSAWVQWAGPGLLKGQPRLTRPAAILREAWRLLLECQPHDSICGTSVDQVHREMGPRFDQVEQIAEGVVGQSLQAIADSVDTRYSARSEASGGAAVSAIVVFNPTLRTGTWQVQAEVLRPEGLGSFDLFDAEGQPVGHQETEGSNRELMAMKLDREGLVSALGTISEGRVGAWVVREVRFEEKGAQLHLHAMMVEDSRPNLAVWRQVQDRLATYLQRPDLDEFVVEARSAPTGRVTFLAREVPGFGYKTYWLRPALRREPEPLPVTPGLRAALNLFQVLLKVPGMGRLLPARHGSVARPPGSRKGPLRAENEFLRLEVSPRQATFDLVDKRSGVLYQGLNRFVDGGDGGDLYDYSPPPRDLLCTGGRLRSSWVENQAASQTIHLQLDLPVPPSLQNDRCRRRLERTTLRLGVKAILASGIPRVDFDVEVENTARDHRLRVHFPAPLKTRSLFSDGHFEVVGRSLDPPPSDDSWVEAPRPEMPQGAWSDISDGQIGLMIANRGLPEIEALPLPDGSTELALTLMRCVGWLSRDDLPTRKGHAGPNLAVPEAQLPGTRRFQYSVIPHTGSWRTGYPEACAYARGSRAVSTTLHPGPLPPEARLIQADEPAFALSAIKTTEQGEGLLIRGYNLEAEARRVHLTLGPPFHRCWRSRLDESRGAELPRGSDGSVTFEAAPHEIVTLIFSG